MFLYSQKYHGPTVHIDMFDKTMFKGPVFELPEGLVPKHFSDALRTVSNGFRTSEQDGLTALDRKFAAQAPCFSYGVSGAVAGFH